MRFWYYQTSSAPYLIRSSVSHTAQLNFIQYYLYENKGESLNNMKQRLFYFETKTGNMKLLCPQNGFIYGFFWPYMTSAIYGFILLGRIPYITGPYVIILPALYG